MFRTQSDALAPMYIHELTLESKQLQEIHQREVALQNCLSWLLIVIRERSRLPPQRWWQDMQQIVQQGNAAARRE